MRERTVERRGKRETERELDYGSGGRTHDVWVGDWLPRSTRRPAATEGTGCAPRERGINDDDDDENGSWLISNHRAPTMNGGQSVDMVWDPQTQTNSLEGWDYSIELAYLKSLKGSSSESSK